MNVLVTGGAGFIGSHLCEELAKQGHAVTALDNLSVSDHNLPLLKEWGVKFVKADIANLDEIEDAFEGIDLVFHLAAMNRAVRSIERPLDSHAANITGTLHVLEAMRTHDVPKIVFASSSSVYQGRSGLLKEDDMQAPPHPYGVGKLASEHYIRIYHELFGIKYVTLRFFSVYGPRQLGTLDKAGVVAKFIHFSRNGKPLTVYGDGEQLRNFTYVKDVVKSCMLAAQTPEAEGHIINIANPNETKVQEVADSILDATQSELAIKYLDPLPSEPFRNAADVQKAQRILGYHPDVSFRQGVQHTVNWYDHYHGIQR